LLDETPLWQNRRQLNTASKSVCMDGLSLSRSILLRVDGVITLDMSYKLN
jgi:hypothetical protein